MTPEELQLANRDFFADELLPHLNEPSFLDEIQLAFVGMQQAMECGLDVWLKWSHNYCWSNGCVKLNALLVDVLIREHLDQAALITALYPEVNEGGCEHIRAVTRTRHLLTVTVEAYFTVAGNDNYIYPCDPLRLPHGTLLFRHLSIVLSE